MFADLDYSKTHNNTLFLLIYLSCYVQLTTVSFFVLNDENLINNLNAIDLALEIKEIENEPIGWSIEEDKITIFKNNILIYESCNNGTKYYNPFILTIPYINGMLLNSNFLKTSFDSKRTNINIFLKDISFSALLLFLKLIDNPDIIVNQMKTRDFLDILMIISILDTEKSKERNYFLKELLRNFMFTMQNGNQIFDLERYSESYHYKYIKKSILMDLLIFFIDFITFNDKSAERCIVLTGNKYLKFTSHEVFFVFCKGFRKCANFEIYLRLNDIGIYQLYKMINEKYLLNMWRFLLNITNIDLLYLIFLGIDTYIKATKLFSFVIFHTEKLYIHYHAHPMELFCKRQLSLFSKNLKVLKLEFDFTLDELKIILNFCDNIHEIVLNTRVSNFEFLDLLITFLVKNPDKICKLYSHIYELDNTDISVLRNFPKNLIFYFLNLTNQSENIEIPLQYLPFLNKYRYSNYENLKLATNYILLECIRYKSIELDYKEYSSPFEIDSAILKSLGCLNTIKYFTLRNILVSDELLLFVLNSKTIECLVIQKFILKNNFKYYLRNNKINQKLLFLDLIESLYDIDQNILVYLIQFKCISCIKLINIYFTKSYFQKFYQYLFRFVTKKDNRICLKFLKIFTNSNNRKIFDYLHFLSEIYDYSMLLKIMYHVYTITNLEYYFFSKMVNLEAISIEIRHLSDCINFNIIFINCNLFKTITTLAIYCSKINKEEMKFFKSFKNLMILCLSCEILDYEAISCMRKKDFKTAQFDIIKPIRADRSNEINNYLDSEFENNFL
ncbi:hypothetical protein CWI37_0079p0050 [Hamiltosporidium tvaerminnensis]|uniref:Uncharacterized protein n=1 Tax=Hamiltosporidium tvaerminnensis TaxID=1176355 RepID=A0A4Q9LAR3_9MICR|nr:hypothetical protein LUQ84_000450 [Hamiltosporidium tvaerminnensis]TBU04858.1 hypothetical protein CWI37_0079p0050 [Hamiltosporidium tvaerminnensis]